MYILMVKINSTLQKLNFYTDKLDFYIEITQPLGQDYPVRLPSPRVIF